MNEWTEEIYQVFLVLLFVLFNFLLEMLWQLGREKFCFIWLGCPAYDSVKLDEDAGSAVLESVTIVSGAVTLEIHQTNKTTLNWILIKFCSILANIMSWYVVIWQQYWPGTVPLASPYRCSSSHEGWQPSPRSRPGESCSSSQSHSRNPSNKASSYRRFQLTGRIEQILKLTNGQDVEKCR